MNISFKLKIIILSTTTLYLTPTAAGAQNGKWMERSGDVLLFTLPAAAAGMTWHHHDQTGLEQFACAGALTVATTYLLKYSINARRPNGENYSFPSGHTSVSFFAAEFIRQRYGPQWGAPAYVAATFVAYTRVLAKKHYLRDVLAGAAIGIGFSALLTEAFDERTRRGDPQIAESAILMLYLPVFINGWNVQTGTNGRQWRIGLSGGR